MFSIKHKIILSNVGTVVLASALIAVPVITAQVRSLKADLTEKAVAQANSACASISSFLLKPTTIVNDMAVFVSSHGIEKTEAENAFDAAITGDRSLYALYFADTVPMNAGGIMYSNDGWDPGTDYDKQSREWYAKGMVSTTPTITEPYIDAETHSPVTTITRRVDGKTAGSASGVVALDILLSDLTDIVSPIKLSASGTSFLLDADGNYLTNSDEKKLLQANFFKDYSVLAGFKSAAAQKTAQIFNAGGLVAVSKRVSDETSWVFVSVAPQSELYAAINRSILITLVLVAVVLVLSLIAASVIARPIIKPIRTVDSVVNHIASGDADLTRRIEVSTNDEIGSLVAGFNKFVGKLHSIVSSIKSSRADLTSVENDLQSGVQDVSASIEQILVNITSVGDQMSGQANAVSQTSAAVAEIAENINSLEHMIENQSQGVTQASSAVEEMIGNISSVNNSVERMADTFEQLAQNAEIGVEQQKTVEDQIAIVAEQSRTLQDANKAIENVASQTNLLAMNAAIEAAHAGEAGKGFSVVADEIRKLSETSAAQSKKITAELGKIRDTIQNVVTSSKISGQSFKDVSQRIQDTDQLVRQIKAAMEEQQVGSQQIVDSLKVMNDSTSEVRTASHEMAEGNRLILEEIHNLQASTGVIKDSVTEMSGGAEEIGRTGKRLSDLSAKMRGAVKTIGDEIDQFEA